MVRDKAAPAGFIVGNLNQLVGPVAWEERPVFFGKPAGHQPPRDFRCKALHMINRVRIEGHHRHRPAIFIQNFGNARFQRADIIPHRAVLIFDFDQNRHLPGHLLEHLLQSRDSFAVGQSQLCQIGGGAHTGRAIGFGQA